MRAAKLLLVVAIAGAGLVLWLVRRDAGDKPAAVSSAAIAREHRTDGQIELDASSATSAPRDARTTAAPARTLSDAGLDVHPRCRVLGRVVDGAGAPVADVRVSMRAFANMRMRPVDTSMLDANGEPHESLTTRTGSKGTFDLEARLPESESIVVAFEGPVLLARASREFEPGPDSWARRLVAGDNDVGDIVLDRCGAVEGRVISVSGAPVEGAIVAPSSVTANTNGLGVKSDAQGRFVVGHLPAGKIALSIVVDQKFVRGDTKSEVRLDETSQVGDIVLSPEFAISGSVVDRDGLGLGGIAVCATQMNGGSGTTISKADGTFTLWLEHKGTCVLSVIAPSFDPWEHADEPTYEVGAKDVRIELHSRGRMSFKVVDAHTHEPIETFGIVVNPLSLALGHVFARERELPLFEHAGGVATLAVPHAESFVVVRATGHATARVPLPPDVAGVEPQTIELQLASGIRGRLKLAGVSVSAATLVLEPDATGTGIAPGSALGARGPKVHYDLEGFEGGERRLHASADGSFAFEDLSPGTYALTIEARGAVHSVLRGIVAPPERELDLGDIALGAGASVRGIISSGHGEIPAGFQVILDRTGRRVVVSTDFGGAFELTGLEPGAHSITWLRPNMGGHQERAELRRTRRIELAAGETQTLTWDASASAPCQVIVTAVRGGIPVPGLRLFAEIDDSAQADIAVQRETDPRPQRAESAGAASREIASDAIDLGTTDEHGLLVAWLEGDVLFDLVAMSSSNHVLCSPLTGLRATPGGRLERTFPITTGTLVIEVPVHLQVPDQGLVAVSLTPRGDKARTLYAYTPQAPAHGPDTLVWKDRAIDLGELPSGEYDMAISFQRFEPDEQHPGTLVSHVLGDPYATSMRIEDGHETRIVVP